MADNIDDIIYGVAPGVKVLNKEFPLVCGDVPQLVLMDFWAPWCAPCRLLEPTLNRVENLFGKRLLVVKANIDLQNSLVNKYNVRSIPTFILLQDGIEILRLAAAECGEAHIITEIKRIIGVLPLEAAAHA